MPIEPSPDRPSPSTERLSYKFQRLREQLRQAIESGQLSGRLPGERHLGRLFSANAKTINKALGDLSAEGLIVRQIGRGTFVAGSSAQCASAHTKLWWWISRPTAGQRPVEPHSKSAAATPASFGPALFEAAHRRLRDCETQHMLIPLTIEEAAVRAARNLRELDGVVLCDTVLDDGLMADLTRRHIPVVAIGGETDNRRVDSVLPDDADAGFRLTEYLFQLGHRRIWVVGLGAHGGAVGDAHASGSSAESHMARIERVYTGYHAACRRRRIGPVAWIEAQKLPAITSEADPVGLIAVGASAGRVVLSWVSSAGPLAKGIEAVCVAEPGDTFAAGRNLTAYEVPIERMADWAVRLLEELRPGRPPVQVVVPGRLTVRGPNAAKHARQESAAPIEAII